MAAFSSRSGSRVCASIAAAPARKFSVSKPCSAAGNRPTALITEVRPPIQSNIGKRASQPLLSAYLSSSLPDAGHGDGMFRKIQTGFFKARPRFEHPVARFLRAAGFGDDDDEGVREPGADLFEDAIEAVRIGVIEKEDIHRIARRAEGVGDELRSERRAADSDEQDVLERLPARRRDSADVNIGGEFLDARVGFDNVGAQLVVRRKRRVAQPVMPDLAFLIRVGDPAGFEVAHRGEGLLDLRLHFFEEAVGKTHPADIERKAEIVVAQKIFLEPLPE